MKAPNAVLMKEEQDHCETVNRKSAPELAKKSDAGTDTDVVH